MSAAAEAASADDSTLASAIGNGEDLGTTVRAAFEIDRPEALLAQLRGFVKRKEVEIEELCRAHYEEFIQAVDELRNVLVDAESLRVQLTVSNTEMQEVGRSLLGRLEKLLEWHGVRSNLSLALAGLRACTACVQLCAQLNTKLDGGDAELYTAVRALDTAEHEVPPARALAAALETHMPLVRAYIERRLIHDFNDWLVDVRDVARNVGTRAMAAARRREEELRTQGGAAAAALLDMDEEEEEEQAVDLTPVYRAYYMHASLGLDDKFRCCYSDNRRLQLVSDMHPPSAAALEPFLAQIAGFFIVEDRVLRTAGGVVDQAVVDSLWETAVSHLCVVLEEHMSRLPSAKALLAVKESGSLLAGTMASYGYATSPLLGVLGRARERYHDLLIDDCMKMVAERLAADKFEQMMLRNEDEYSKTVLTLGLQPCETIPAFPYVAPFSASVPACCSIIRDFAMDSMAFLPSGTGAEVMHDVVDRAVLKCLNEELMRMAKSPTVGLSQAMQLVANLIVLEQRACDFWAGHVAWLCGMPSRVAASFSLSRAALRQTQAVVQDRMLALVKSKIDDFMLLTAHIDWTPDQPPQHGNAYLNEVVIYLETLAPSAAAILPGHALDRWLKGLLSHISDCILASLASDDVRKLNTNAVMGLDTDLRMLESFANEHEQHASVSLCSCLAPARQIMNLILSDQPELYLNPVIREKSYGALVPSQLIVIADKYCDLPDKRGETSKKKSFETLVKRLNEFA